MNKTLMIVIVAGVAILLIAGGGLYVANQKSEQKKMAAEKAAMMKQEEDAKMMKQKEDEAAMMKQDAMNKMSYTLKGGTLMINENGKMSLVTKSVTLSNGNIITKTGLITGKDGSTIQLKEGESVKDDGSVMKSDVMMTEQVTPTGSMKMNDNK